MKRLTFRDEYGNADIIALSDMMPEVHASLSFSESNALMDALNRLAAYEDTGLEPEEIKSLQSEWYVNLGVLGSYREAESDGRLLVLPCKVGSTAYFILEDIEEVASGFVVSEPHTITEVGSRGFWTSSLPYDKPDAMHDFTPWEEIGKTVFLTREEAEKALEGMK